MLLLAACSNRCPQTPEASFSDSNPLSEHRNGHGPILRLRFLSFFKCALLPNINHVAELEFLFVGAEQLEHLADEFAHLPGCIGLGDKRRKCGTK
jgi:hypothetical protein